MTTFKWSTWPVVFSHKLSVHTSFCPSVSKLQIKRKIIAGRNCGLAEWIIDDYLQFSITHTYAFFQFSFFGHQEESKLDYQNILLPVMLYMYVVVPTTKDTYWKGNFSLLYVWVQKRGINVDKRNVTTHFCSITFLHYMSIVMSVFFLFHWPHLGLNKDWP